MKKSLFILVVLIFNIQSSFCQTKRYHEYDQTASDYQIIRWNIPQDSLAFFESYIEEFIDLEGRVRELRFLKNGKLEKGRLCYLPDIVKYTYPNKSTIVETLYNSDGSKMNGLECEVNFKTTYKLNSFYNIESAQIEYFIDSVELRNKRNISCENLKIELDFINKNTTDSSANSDASLFIHYYLKSYAKLKRKFPINNKRMKDEWISNTPEEVDAQKCMFKLNTNE